jgi:hypothetical protein
MKGANAMRTTYRNLLMGALVLLGLTLSERSRAADIKLQTWRQKSKAVQSRQEVVPSKSARAMDCALCTSTTVVVKRDLVAGKSGHGFKEVTKTVHQCPTCRDTIARKGGTKEFVLSHTCQAVGESPNCCETTGASGRGA